ncbi:hypothetical protein RI129_008804 [Pyrocoelia pectoralis]|uniref:THAP-type domain-containing protein n=1 Tax=Pyrocoelia pectoralis TaxID=417401 RepID=A0AAN7ZHR8_9COLE
MRAIRRKNFNPTNDSVICGKHFKDADFLRKVPTKVLKSDAIPSVFDFPVHLKVKSPKHRRTIIRHPLPPSERWLEVKVSSSLSDQFPSSSGVPQGSHLGPLLKMATKLKSDNKQTPVEQPRLKPKKIVTCNNIPEKYTGEIAKICKEIRQEGYCG